MSIYEISVFNVGNGHSQLGDYPDVIPACGYLREKVGEGF
jgi:hypothetical protein